VLCASGKQLDITLSGWVRQITRSADFGSKQAEAVERGGEVREGGVDECDGGAFAAADGEGDAAAAGLFAEDEQERGLFGGGEHGEGALEIEDADKARIGFTLAALAVADAAVIAGVSGAELRAVVRPLVQADEG
jgi:hypothetical protein